MKRKILYLLCVFMLLSLAGCANYSSIENALEKVKIENTLPEIEEGKYTVASDADDDIYEQQLALCDMYSEAYEKTYYQQFLGDGEKFKPEKVASICNDYRKEINNKSTVDFYLNIYNLIKNCDDITNKEAFLQKTNNDVLGFYNSYIKYINSDDEQTELCNLLVNFSERRNILALSFLERNKHLVYEAATNMVEENAATDENFRYYLNINNKLVNALNNVYGGVPARYADRISVATTELSRNLLNSFETITERERAILMEQLELNTPSPTPKATPTPMPSGLPIRTPLPMQTPLPARTVAPATKAPAKTTAPAVEQPVIQQPQVIYEPTQESGPQETELPSYSFSVND